MKRNSILFIILISIGLFTYYFEELGTKKEIEENIKKAQLIDTTKYGELQELQTKNSHIIFSKSTISTKKKNIPCSTEKINDFFKRISSLRIVRTLELEEVQKLGEEHFFESMDNYLNFVFEEKVIKFFLGKKIDFDESFYVKVYAADEIKYFVVKDSAPKTGVYSKENEHNSDLAYIQFQNLIFANDSYFFDTRIFKDSYFKDLKKGRNAFSEINVLNKRNRAYTVYFEKLITEPESFKNIKYDTEEFKKYFEYVLKLEAKNMFEDFSVKLLKDFSSQMNIKDSIGRTVTLSVYKSYGSLKGYFLTSSLDSFLYELHEFDKGIFFQNVQDFWSLKLDEQFLEGTFQIEYDKEYISLNIDKSRGLKVINVTNSKEAIHSRFSTIVSLFGQRADYITKLSSQSKTGQGLMLKNHLKQYLLTKEKNEIIVIDLSSDIKYHYKVTGNLNLSLNVKDYFLEK